MIGNNAVCRCTEYAAATCTTTVVTQAGNGGADRHLNLTDLWEVSR